MKVYSAPDYIEIKVEPTETFASQTYVCDGRFTDTYFGGCQGNPATWMMLEGVSAGNGCYTRYDVIPGVPGRI